jgi:CDP-glucose 4,6-dehydratase
LENLEMSDFWRGKRVLVTGHTGFKGSWLSLWLSSVGAKVTGLSLEPESPFFDALGVEREINHIIGDICEPETLRKCVAENDPEVVFHMAAQSLVLRGYRAPQRTWETNVMGTLNVLEALRTLTGTRAVIMVTTDKVYANDEQGRPYQETDKLGGHDPYSSSKAAMEIVVESWRKSFFVETGIRVATVRAGNVIGGGDWAENRVIPDVARALQAGAAIVVRNPDAVRPWQHVLEPLRGYMTLAERMYLDEDPALQGPFNFGPSEDGMRCVRDLVNAALEVWPGRWEQMENADDSAHEAKLLTLCTAKAERVLGHVSRWSFEAGVAATINWYKAVSEGRCARDVSLAQLRDYGAL